MKFARYLQDTQTPEWKKAYIDYRGLKVQLGVIRAQVPQQVDASSHTGVTDPAPSNEERPEDSAPLSQGSTTSALARGPLFPATSSGHEVAIPVKRKSEKPSLRLTMASLPPPMAATASTAPSKQTPLPPRTPRSHPVFPFFHDSGPPTPVPLHTILFHLPATHTKFFTMLDEELDKVESFYAEREKEMEERNRRLREQLSELGVHRQTFYTSSTQAKTHSWVNKAQRSALATVTRWFQGSSAKPEEGLLASESGRGGPVVVDPPRSNMEHICQSSSHAASSLPARDDSAGSRPKRSNSPSAGGTKHLLDPHEYQHAKRRLQKAVIEHYRGLETLNNYRILNLTGFRKALKKYEKITKNSVLDAYMKEKVEPSAFVSGATVSSMLKEMEDLFATRFEHGDRKKAMDRLRLGPFSKTNHLSTFRSGLWLGLALPAIAGSAYLSFREDVRASLPAWDVLLFIYSILLVPVLLALLIGINIAVWAREKINYVFIFDLNPRSRLDHHEYFELPAFFLSTLAMACWCSMAEIGPPMLWPLIWMALGLIVMFNPVQSFMWGPARWWTTKNMAKLWASGVWKVEFTDFWLGDQLCSLSYSFSNLFFAGCYYTRFFANFSMLDAATSTNLDSSATFSVGITIPYRPDLYTAKSVFQGLTSTAFTPQVQDVWSTCGTARNWGWYYLLGILPLLVRFIQSVRRYCDSRLHTHLINAGKYGMGMVYYFFYYYWRYQGEPRAGASYILWCFTASIYAIYGCTWDFLMDWSLCKLHAPYPLLRPELIFKTHISSYYFALMSNLCLRFLWLIYVPTGGVNMTLRGFVIAMLEMLRRVQWNSYRLENEHLGNMDQYRVTREVPLPYNFDAPSNEEEHEREEEEMREVTSALSVGVWWKKWIGWTRRNGGHG